MAFAFGINRLHIEDLSPANRQGKQITVPQIRGFLPEGLVAGHLVGGDHGVLGLLWALGEGIGWQNPHGDLAVVVRVGTHRHVGCQILPVEATEWRNQLEGRLTGFRVGCHHIEGRLGSPVGFGYRGVVRHGPEPVVCEEVPGIIDVVAGENAALHLEHVLRIAQVIHELLGNLPLGLHRAGEHPHPGLQHWVFLIKLIEVHRAVVSINHSLHRVTDIADFIADQGTLGRPNVARGVIGGGAQAGGAGVRETVERRIAINDPLDATINDRRVGCGIGRQPWRYFMHALPRIAFEQDFGIAVDALGKNEVHFLVSGRKRGTVEHISDIDATLTLIGVCGGIRVVFHRVAGFGTHHGVVFPVTGGSD